MTTRTMSNARIRINLEELFGLDAIESHFTAAAAIPLESSHREGRQTA